MYAIVLHEFCIIQEEFVVAVVLLEVIKSLICMLIVACPAGCQYCVTDKNSGSPVCQFGQCKISYYMKSDRSCAGVICILGLFKQ